jgi:hypothetical protein
MGPEPRARSAANLTFGVVFTTLAVAALVALLFLFDEPSSDYTISGHIFSYLPRFTVAALLQIVAVFFLKMHASNESDIKNNKNEITNVEARLAAGQVLSAGNGFAEFSKALAGTERNFLLENGQAVAGSTGSPEIQSMMELLGKIIESSKLKTD